MLEYAMYKVLETPFTIPIHTHTLTHIHLLLAKCWAENETFAKQNSYILEDSFEVHIACAIKLNKFNHFEYKMWTESIRIFYT